MTKSWKGQERRVNRALKICTLKTNVSPIAHDRGGGGGGGCKTEIILGSSTTNSVVWCNVHCIAAAATTLDWISAVHRTDYDADHIY